jgi:hypothetical protein
VTEEIETLSQRFVVVHEGVQRFPAAKHLGVLCCELNERFIEVLVGCKLAQVATDYDVRNIMKPHQGQNPSHSGQQERRIDWVADAAPADERRFASSPVEHPDADDVLHRVILTAQPLR